MRVYEGLAAELRAQGVRAGFTLMSEDTAPLIVEMGRQQVSVYHTRHEAAAIGMAHGYAQASGAIGVAVVGRGPAVTNAITLLLNASKDRVGIGLLVIAGDTALRDAAAPEPGAGQLKYIDQGGVLDVLGVTNIVLRSPESAVADFRAACAHARAGGAVVVNVPFDVSMSEAGAAAAGVELPPLCDAPPPDRQDIETVADVLGETWAAKRPVILAGRGAVLAGALPDLERLAERTGALLGTTLLASALFKGSAWDLGVCGTVQKPAATEMLADADLVLVFGASLQPLTTWRGESFPKARVIQFDTDPRAFGRHLPVALGVRADARLAAAALADLLERRDHRSTGYRTPDVAARLAGLRADTHVKDEARDGLLDPKVAMRRIDELLPADRAIVIETGHCLSFTAGYLSVPDPGSFHFPHGFGTIGAAVGFTLGVAVARPDRLAVWAGGDGSFMMTVGDIDTAVRYRLPVVFLICNDGGFGAEVHMLEVAGEPGESAHYANPSFEAVARSLGAEGLTIGSLADAEQLRERLVGLSGPLVVDCRVDPRVEANWVEFFYGRREDAAAAR